MADKNTEQSQTDLSFLDDKQSVTFRIKDIVFLLLRNVHWLLLFAIVGAVIANFYARRQEKTYASHAKILIRSGNELGISDDDTREATLRTSLGLRSFYSSTINNEIMILTSKTTVRKVVEELDLNMSYSTKTRFIHRDKELYRSSPIEIVTADREEGFTLPGKMTVTIINKNYALLHSAGHHSLYIPFDKTVITPMGRLSIRKTWAFEEDYIGQDIIVHNRPVESVADYYRGKLVVERDSEKNTILNLSMRDGSAQRCADFINALIRVYNDGAVNDKKRIISDTYNYINERINIISGDLDAQESAMANYRSSNDVVTSSMVGERYISESINSNSQIIHLQSELTMVRSLLDAIRSSDGGSVIPIGSITNGTQPRGHSRHRQTTPAAAGPHKHYRGLYCFVGTANNERTQFGQQCYCKDAVNTPKTDLSGGTGAQPKSQGTALCVAPFTPRRTDDQPAVTRRFGQDYRRGKGEQECRGTQCVTHDAGGSAHRSCTAHPVLYPAPSVRHPGEDLRRY